MNHYPLVRYELGGEIAYGAVVDGRVRALPGGLFGDRAVGAEVAALDAVRLLAPCQPTKIVAVGRNYVAHAAEFGSPVPDEPLIFLKPPSTVVGPGAAVIYPAYLSERVDHEAELAVVIGRRAHRVARAQALEFVLGYTCGNDVTARDLQRRDGQWSRAKGFDTFCPLGPWIVTGLDVGDLSIRASVNGIVRQDARTRDMIFPVDELIAYVSAVMTLEPGDVLLTGTPAGVGPVQPGDRMAVHIEKIGELWNDVIRSG